MFSFNILKILICEERKHSPQLLGLVRNKSNFPTQSNILKSTNEYWKKVFLFKKRKRKIKYHCKNEITSNIT